MTTTESDAVLDHLDASRPADEVRAAHAEMRERCPVVHSPRHGGFDFVGRYADVRGALTEPATFSSADGVFIPPSGLPRVPALEWDEPEHSKWRAMLEAPLTPASVRAFEPTLAEIVNLLIDGFAGRGHADLVAEFAAPLPAIVIGRMVGLDQRAAVEAAHTADALFESIATPAFDERMAEFVAFTETQLTERRREPREDFLTALAQRQVAGVPIDDAGAAGLLVAYLLGGHHSTSSGVAGLLRHVLVEPGLREEIEDNERIVPRVVEESLRLTTPLQLFARTTTCPVDVGGEPVPAGRRVMLNLAAANRDPREFEDPEQFVPQRKRNRHVAFGAGAHVCQGQHLARAEMRIALRELLSRLPDLRVDGEIEQSGLKGGKLMTVSALPVAFTPER
ncbi:cytochrome P450 [Amycolatopsis rhabdoformis]|uniref:Cytochrome P450 n=1 Tax=Amycolatopsis rhabdoformis TaxID=1448059 RepID=A0ABZ1ILI8_9PSEU|nr:cytochrome P450 [Amycolatopsis rhabdoformis]WSE34736.1 cytochrome P450 [Amycolatopsis rhabdoformis]